jgi:hypothetical protein
MIDIKKYMERTMNLRLRGEYSGRNPVYIHGEVSLTEALGAFERFGQLNFVQECSKGKRVTVWDKRLGWGRLGELLKIE